MRRFIAEFQEQSYTQIIFPHKDTDWVEYLQEAQESFVNIVNVIKRYQKVLLVCHSLNEVKKHFKDKRNIHFVEYTTDDTWARDCSALCISENSKVTLLNFTFNAWGNKFEALKDNAMTAYLNPDAQSIEFILEGGAVESNGKELLLTTSNCIFNQNRNPQLNKNQIINRLKKYFGSSEILSLEHGYLAGDDTDSHIDTLARFVDEKSIMYVTCKDKRDQHYQELALMEQELQTFAYKYSLKLIPLPMCEAIYYEGERLPATYANFLFVNGAVLVPTYGVKEDEKALEVFRNFFKKREVVAVDSHLLIRQHGSLHCVTMNFARGVKIS